MHAYILIIPCSCDRAPSILHVLTVSVFLFYLSSIIKRCKHLENLFFAINLSSTGKYTTMAGNPAKQKLWGGRFTGQTDPLCFLPSYHVVPVSLLTNSHRMHAFNESLKYDQRMHAADIRGSIAYAKSLTLVGILTKEEETKIVQGLTAVGKEWESGQVDSVSPYDDLSYRSPPYAVSYSAG